MSLTTLKSEKLNCVKTSELGFESKRSSHLRFGSSRFANITQFSFRYGVEKFTFLRRTLRFTIIDFLSYVGGVLGLFAGISVLSFFEIFYFFIVRILSNFFATRKTLKHAVVIVRPAE